MIKAYPDFIDVVNGKIALYEQIPEGHLTVEGQKAHELYKAVKFLSCFTSCAVELLEMVHEDKDVEAAAKFAASDLRQIVRCLERLAAAEYKMQSA